MTSEIVDPHRRAQLVSRRAPLVVASNPSQTSCHSFAVRATPSMAPTKLPSLPWLLLVELARSAAGQQLLSWMVWCLMGGGGCSFVASTALTHMCCTVQVPSAF